jgi:serine protease
MTPGTQVSVAPSGLTGSGSTSLAFERVYTGKRLLAGVSVIHPLMGGNRIQPASRTRVSGRPSWAMLQEHSRPAPPLERSASVADARPMRRSQRSPWIVAAVAVLGPAVAVVGRIGPAAAEVDRVPAATDRVIVHFDRTVSRYDAPAAVERLEDEVASRSEDDLAYVRVTGSGAVVVDIGAAESGAALRDTLADLAAADGVAAVEPDAWMRPDAVPDDPEYANQWHYQPVAASNYGLDLPAAWDTTTGSTSVVVAVIDTGSLPHPDIVDRLVPGYDMIASSTNARDGDARDSDATDQGDWCTANGANSTWHGLHVAGTIGASSDNGVGVTGVDWNARIQHVRALGACGGWSSDVDDAIRWAVGLPVSGLPTNATPAKVVNMSLGGTGACGVNRQSAIDAAVAAGAIIVVSAGNSNTDASSQTPANCNNVITVAASSKAGNRATYSNYGSIVDITAPGGNMYLDSGVLSLGNSGSTTAGSYAYSAKNGTSMASPHVSGVLSLMASIEPDITYDEALAILQGTATPFPVGSTCTTNTCGPGILNAAAAVAAVEQASAPLAVTSPAGGEAWYTNETHTIAWSHGGNSDGTATLDVVNGVGTTVATIATGVQVAALSHAWTLPADLPTGVPLRVRLRTSFPVRTAVSSSFTVTASSLTVTSPDGGEAWTATTTQDITWDSEGSPGDTVAIALLRTGASTPVVLTASAPNTGSWAWTISPKLRLDEPGSPTYTIRVTPSAATADESDAAFAIKDRTFDLTSPSSPLTVTAGGPVPLAWTSEGDMGATLTLSAVNTSTGARTTVAKIAPTSPAVWRPSVKMIGGTYQVNLRSTKFAAYQDTSSGTVAVSAPSLTLTAPASPPTVAIGAPVPLEWELSGESSLPLLVEVFSGAGKKVGTVSKAAATGGDGTGTLVWYPSGKLSPGTYTVRLSVVGLPSVSRAVDVTVTSTSMTVDEPEVTPSVAVGGFTAVAWNVADNSQLPMRIALVSPSGRVVGTLAKAAPTGVGGVGTADVQIPSKVPPGPYVVRVTAADNEALGGEYPITVIDTAISLTGPDGGETLHLGATETVSWTLTNGSQAPVRIELVRGDGSVVARIAATAPTTAAGSGSYAWAVPMKVPAGTYSIRLTVAGRVDLTDTSSAPFDLALPTLAVTAPAGTTITPGQTVDVTWTASHDATTRVNVILQKSDGSAATALRTKVATVAGAGTYSWTVSSRLIPGSYRIVVVDSTVKTLTATGADFTVAAP